MRPVAILLSIALAAAAAAQTPPAGDPAAPPEEPIIPLNIDPKVTYDSTKAMNGLTLAEVEAVAARAGYKPAKITGSYEYLELTTSTGYRFEASLADCPESGEQRCASLNLRSYSFNETSKVTLKGVNEWNTNAWGVRGMLFKDGTSGVSMNVGVDGGVTEAWIAARIANYDYWLNNYGQFVNGTP